MKKDIRTHWLTVRLNKEEHELLQQLFRQSTNRKVSDYVRRLILNKPVNVRYRNESFDAFLTEMLEMKKGLNAIGNNFSHAVKRLHSLEKVPEFLPWILQNEQDKAILFDKIGEIIKTANQFYQQWSRE